MKVTKQIPESPGGSYCDLSSRQDNLDISPSKLWSNKPVGLGAFVVTFWSRTENYQIVGFSSEHHGVSRVGQPRTWGCPRPTLFTQSPGLICSCSSQEQATALAGEMTNFLLGLSLPLISKCLSYTCADEDSVSCFPLPCKCSRPKLGVPNLTLFQWTVMWCLHFLLENYHSSPVSLLTALKGAMKSTLTVHQESEFAWNPKRWHCNNNFLSLR